MKTFTGIPASMGSAAGLAFVYPDDDTLEIPRYGINETEIPAELERLQKARNEASLELKTLYERAETEMGKDQANIFMTHLIMLEDEDFFDQIKNSLTKNLYNIEWIFWDMSRELSQKLLQSPDPVFRERAVDITDISRRIINCLLGTTCKRTILAELKEDVILIAHDLLPSEMLILNKSKVKGIALDMGSSTCHTAILSRAFQIPAVLGLSEISGEVKNGETVAINGSSGIVTVNPDKQTLERHENEKKLKQKQLNGLTVLRDLPAVTTDGRRVILKANIEFPEEAEKVLHYGAEGIGLYRSEFLFLTPGKAADEETQYEAYSKVIKTMGRLPVTIRTADVGGDKIIPELHTGSEKNPLLGWRAIRVSLANPEMFKVQLRAILRASVSGNVKIMFPMISGIEEFEQACALFDEAKAECKKKRQPFNENIETGIMIEIPSAAMTADILAEKSDFFSIGTNDLIQYSLAVDRGNEKVNYLSESLHPAVLRFIKKTIDAAHEKGIKAAMCGELAGDTKVTGILTGLGLDEFSMTASFIPQVKEIIRNVSHESCKTLAAEALRCRSNIDINIIVKNWMENNVPQRNTNN